MAPSIALGGTALHAGVPSAVLFAAHDGPVVLAQNGRAMPLDRWVVARADAGVCVRSPDGMASVDLVEHVLAAVGGLGIEHGLRIVVDGPEPPLVDGGAAAFASAIGRLRIAPVRQRTCRVVKRDRVEIGSSIYEVEPSDRVSVEVAIEFDHPLVVVQRAVWDGSAAAFERAIAPARTFGFLAQWGALKAAGRAKGANTRDVVVLCPDGTSPSDPRPEPDECVRHKLLDLIGDMTLTGGVPLGRVRVQRPGHRTNLEAMRRLLASGVVQRG